MTLSFAGVQVGVARHFDRPAMRALSKLWQLLAIATIPNILSSFVGAAGNKELSRALNTVVIALLAAGIPYVRLATDALASATPPVRDTRRDALAWALAALLLHGVGVFGSTELFPEARVVTVTVSRLIKLAVIAIPDERFGEVGLAVVAPSPGATLTLDEITEHLRDRLARFKHPRALRLVAELPRNVTGKISRAQLRAEHGGVTLG